MHFELLTVLAIDGRVDCFLNVHLFKPRLVFDMIGSFNIYLAKSFIYGKIVSISPRANEYIGQNVLLNVLRVFKL